MRTPRAPVGESGTNSIQREVRRYLRTGDHDLTFAGWPGDQLLARCERGRRALADALVAEVSRRVQGRDTRGLPKGIQLKTFARAKVGPMVTGLFPVKEREVILDLLENSLVFLTRDNIEQVLRDARWPHTAWSLANIYLGSIGAEGLDGSPSSVVGLSEETTCYVSLTYFDEDDPFADFVIHEAAHVFHNWKRESVGLPRTRYREWLLQIDYVKREEFAYACEAYHKIVDRAASQADRRRLLAECADRWVPTIDQVDQEELVDILSEAVAARNGWKRILSHCAPPRRIPYSERLRVIEQQQSDRTKRPGPGMTRSGSHTG